MPTSRITAEWVGGPYDGQRVVLASCSMPYQLVTNYRPTGVGYEADVTTVDVWPKRKGNRWVLRWPYSST